VPLVSVDCWQATAANDPMTFEMEATGVFGWRKNEWHCVADSGGVTRRLSFAQFME
jgi:hypothetical protein